MGRQPATQLSLLPQLLPLLQVARLQMLQPHLHQLHHHRQRTRSLQRKPTTGQLKSWLPMRLVAALWIPLCPKLECDRAACFPKACSHAASITQAFGFDNDTNQWKASNDGMGSVAYVANVVMSCTQCVSRLSPAFAPGELMHRARQPIA